MERTVQQCPTVDRQPLAAGQGIGEATPVANGHSRVFNRVIAGDARAELPKLPEASIDLSFWSPPYYVGKSYERHLSFDDWRELLRDVIRGHSRVVKPGGFLAVNIGDILCFSDASGFYLYDQRIWHKDPCWANSRWHSNSYRAVDEFEHVYVFWRPGITQYDRHRLTPSEWAQWGSRGVWNIRSVGRNERHEAEFPEELANRVIRLFSPVGGVVLDPFVGTGTTTKVAKLLGRQWLGIDVEAEHAHMARRRTDDVVQALTAPSLLAVLDSRAEAAPA